jgi:hypothetical protein
MTDRAWVFAFTLALTPISADLAMAQPTVPPQGYQSDAAFAASFAGEGVGNVSATSQKVSCYTPELEYFAALGPQQGYLDGGMSPCNGQATTGEDLGPYPTQDVLNDPMQVKDKSESDMRVDPTDPLHLIGQSKWAVSAEGYNHLTGFYESFDGGLTWPVQGHVPGYEGWVDNTDPVGAFDQWGNFYSLLLPYQFYYDKTGGKHYQPGRNQTNPTVPPTAISVAVHPKTQLPGKTPAASWITTHGGKPDYIITTPRSNTQAPDKQWITVDTNPDSPFLGRIYAMWNIYIFNPGYMYVSIADANPDGTHSDWSKPVKLPTIDGKPWDGYMQPQVTPDGTVWTATTNNPPVQGYIRAAVYLVWSEDGGETWQGPLPVKSRFQAPHYQNTTFREGITVTFAAGLVKVGQNYPLYVAYEEGGSGLSRVFLTASYDRGHSWTDPILVNDNQGPTEAMQPQIDVAENGTVAVAFYDRRLACPSQGDPEAAGSGVIHDPGTAASPGTPWGRANYCINTAIQFYEPDLTPIGHNIRLSAHTWDPQLSSYKPSGISSPTGFIGDYFGIDSADGSTFVTSTSTYNHGGENPFFHQQQVVAKIATP